MKRRREGVQGRNGQAEAHAQQRRCRQQQRERDGGVGLEELADDQQQHRDQAGSETGQVHPLGREATAQPSPEQRGGDRGRHLRQEQEAVLGIRQVVLARAREDRAGRGECDQHDSLRRSRGVDNARFCPRRHGHSRRSLEGGLDGPRWRSLERNGRTLARTATPTARRGSTGTCSPRRRCTRPRPPSRACRREGRPTLSPTSSRTGTQRERRSSLLPDRRQHIPTAT
jgi:hypothetical protein